ncbi:MAG: hypothetical protein OQL19_00070 [Gammaproteobacteria bacterium]|nr:hypothetical protein [Gammaproteobacteria bacterium]
MMDYEAKLVGQIISLRNQKHTILNHIAEKQSSLSQSSLKNSLNRTGKLNHSLTSSKDASAQIRIYNGQIEALTNKLKMLDSFYFH